MPVPPLPTPSACESVRAPLAAKLDVAVAPNDAMPAESCDVDAPAANCCKLVKTLPCAVLSDATTEPVVGLIVSVPSEFTTELTAPLPEPHAAPVVESRPDASAWTQLVSA